MKTIVYNRNTNQYFSPEELEVLTISEEMYSSMYYQDFSNTDQDVILHEDEGTYTPKYKYFNPHEKITSEIKAGVTHVWCRFFMPQLVEAVIPRITANKKAITQGPPNNERVVFHSENSQTVYKYYQENFGGKDFEINN